MRRRNLLVGSAIAALLTATPAIAESAAAQTSPAEADAEVQRLEAAVRNARQAARLAREGEAARLAQEAETARRQADEASARSREFQGLAMEPPGKVCPAQPARTEGLTGESLRAETNRAQEQDATCRFGGVEFGAGISYTIARGPRRVTSAQLVNGIVRVSDEDNGRARLLLESHFFFTPGSTKMWGIGPFVAIQPGEGEVIEAFAGGLMIGFRRAANSTQSFNLGFGIVLDPNTRLLGEGIVADQPLPAGETEIRYQERSQSGWLLMASFGF